ncbi:hypothetical protein [Myxosarcina sp. GI1]|uniref:hypothetical protein n=1 Tax=Myxosarcina sp. GI1 TaxID=1541065 RepID=UPI00055AFCF4|nr:hypothetical protein [Myxosarcina sp. GI1]
MTSRQTDKVTRVDIRLPNELYDQISAIAVDQFHAKIHHRSGKPEVTPTILKLIELGIGQLESSLSDVEETDTELKERVRDLDTRLEEVEAKLSGVNTVAVKAEPELEPEPEPPADEREGLSDDELSSLINLSSIFIYRYRRDGHAIPNVAERLKDWEFKGDRWVRKE